MKIYLSGPISGHTLVEREKVFREAKQEMEARGFEVFNPMENGLPSNATTNEHMKRDIEALLTCSHIYMMPRWLHSAGCKLEFDIATACGLKVIFAEISNEIQFT